MLYLIIIIIIIIATYLNCLLSINSKLNLSPLIYSDNNNDKNMNNNNAIINNNKWYLIDAYLAMEE
jgi:hypothetical protein